MISKACSGRAAASRRPGRRGRGPAPAPARPSPCRPRRSTASAPTSTPSKVMLAAPRLSASARCVRVTPWRRQATRNRVIPSLSPAVPRGAGRDDQQVGGLAVEHEGLLARQDEAVAAFLAFERRVPGRMVRPSSTARVGDGLAGRRSSAARRPSGRRSRPASGPRRRSWRWRAAARRSGCGRSPPGSAPGPDSRTPSRQYSSGTITPAQPISAHLGPGGGVERRARARCRAACAERSRGRCPASSSLAASRSMVCSSVRTAMSGVLRVLMADGPVEGLFQTVVAPEELAVGGDEGGRAEQAARLGLGGHGPSGGS